MGKIKIAIDFSDTPGARYRTDGDFSGQEFLEELLGPEFERCQSTGEKLLIDLDDCWGYPSSFLSGSFGVLSERYGADACLEVLEFKSADDPNLETEIRRVIVSPEAR